MYTCVGATPKFHNIKWTDPDKLIKWTDPDKFVISEIS